MIHERDATISEDRSEIMQFKADISERDSEIKMLTSSFERYQK